MSEIYGYVRVSTQEQNEERQFLVRIEKNHRLRLVLATLPPLSKEVLIRIYRKKEKWEYIEQHLDISHSKLARLKKKALQDVCEIYDSSYTNRQLAKLKNTTTVAKKEVKMEGREAVLPGQLKINRQRRFWTMKKWEITSSLE